MKNYVVIHLIGDDYAVYGPFSTMKQACLWARINIGCGEHHWKVTLIRKPKNNTLDKA